MSEKEKKQFSFWIRKDVFAELEALAEEQDFSVAWIVNKAIKNYLENEKGNG